MRNTKRDVPVYLMTGFLESGKTTFIDDTAQQDYFRIPQSTLIINCESGEVEYSEGKLKKLKTFVLDVEDQESFTEAYLQKIEDEMKPGRVIIEYNPLWSVKALREWKLPAGWEIIQQIVIVDASTFDIYKNNMRPLFVEMSQNAERLSWTFEEVDSKLKGIMENIYKNIDEAAKKYGMEGNYVAGANIAGFLKVVDAMEAQGIV